MTFKVTSLNNNIWKIYNVSDPESYRAVSHKLNTEKIEWYTYENKSERPHRVVARGLHSSCRKDDVVQDLQTKGFKIIDAVNLIKKEKRKTERDDEVIVKRGLPLFMLSFEKSENLDKIYNIKSILNIVVKIEPVRKSTRLILKCKRCQGYNHTHAYCQKEPRCVKCAGAHLSEECGIKRQDSPTCINCKGKHPANYRGCEVAKELQKRRDLTQKTSLPIKKRSKNKFSKENRKPATEGKTKAKEMSKQPKPKERKADVQKPTNRGPQTYAEAALQANNRVVITTPDPVHQVFSAILERLEEQSQINKRMFDKLNKLESKLRDTPTAV